MTETEVSIRPAAASDTGALAFIASSSFPLACPAGTPPDDIYNYVHTELTPARFTAHLADPELQLLVASVDGDPAGYAMLKAGSTHASIAALNPLEVRRFYVRKLFHGTGVADRLMRYIVDDAERRGHDRLWLQVSARNARAIAFYRRWRLSQTGAAQVAFGSGIIENWVLARPLPAGYS
jgi:GNAT superfamily N-acetyltransferase